MKRLSRFAATFVALLCGSLLAQTVPNQVTPNNLTGIMPYNTYGGVRENINLATGDLNLRIPIISLPGRNGHEFELAVIYDSKIWDLHNMGNPDIGDLYSWSYDNFGPSPRLNTPWLDETTTDIDSTLTCDTNFVFVAEDGGKHPFTVVKNNGNRGSCYTYPKTGPHNGTPCPSCAVTQGDSVDASFVHLDTTNYPTDSVIYLKDGERLHFTSHFPTSFEDTDGNLINFSGYPTTGITDTLKRQVTWSGNNSSSAISYKDSNGNPQTVTIGYTTLTLTPHFSPVQGINIDPGSFNVPMLTSITLPNGRSYTFQYNTYGELTKLIYPMGGYTRYDYAAFTAVYGGGDNTSADFREVTAKHVCTDPAGGCTTATELTTTYMPTIPQSWSSNQYVDVQEPQGRLTHYQFSGASPTLFSPRELSRTVSDNGTTLRTITTAYNNLANGNTTNASLPINKTTTLTDITPNQMDETTWAYDTINTSTIDNVTNESEYDYGSGAVGSLIRQTVSTYLHTNSVNGVDYTTNSIHILNRKLTENIEDGSNNTLSQTSYEYDNYAANGGLSASGTVQHDSAFSTGYTTRGNVTATKRWRNTDGAWLSTTHHYDDAGNVLSTTDPKSNTTSFSYGDSWANGTCTPSGGSAAAYVTVVTNALNQTSHFSYNSCSGTMASTTDLNSQPTSFTYDLMGRLSQTNFPDTGQISYCYSDLSTGSCYSTGQIYITRSDKINTSGATKTTAAYVNGIGQVVQTQLTTDPEGIDYTDITYDGLERKASVSNPHRSAASSTDGSTQYVYDALDRVKVATQPDGSIVNTSYSGNQMTVTDEAGKKRKSSTDALGRMTGVWEDPSGLNYETDYSYNALGNLLSVTQKGGDSNSGDWRPRTFSYDSFSRITSATNPESGTITYFYTNNGALCAGDMNAVCSKTAPAPNPPGSGTVTTTYSYDGLNRLTLKSYSDGTTPAAQFIYDVSAGWGSIAQTNIIGRLSEATAGTSPRAAEIFGYDPLGRIVLNDQCTPSNCGTNAFLVNYTYDLAGDLTSGSNGEGVTINYSYDGATRPTQVTSTFVDPQHPGTLFTEQGYSPAGALTQMTYGNGLLESRAYNNRLQPAEQQIYYSSGFVRYDFTYGYNSPYNNGNVMSWNSTGWDFIFNRSYGYDNLNRLFTMSDSASGQNCKGLQWTYDAWGNRTNQAVTSGSCSTFSAVATTQNQLSGYQYDAAGNMTYDGTHHYAYDAENRIIQVDGGSTATYVYDAEGRRAEKDTPGWTDYIHDLNGNQVTEVYATGWGPGYVYLGGNLITEYKNGTTYFVQSDHLGNTRVMTGVDGSGQQSWDYQPFGELTQGVFVTDHLFTGKERDAETNLDMFGARYYGSTLGRFVTPDWAAKPTAVPYASFGNPQSLNLYQYVLNNPLSIVDADGHELTVAAELQDQVSTMRERSTSYNAELSADEGPHAPNLTIQFGATPNDPSGKPSIGNTNAPIVANPVVSTDPKSDNIEYSMPKDSTTTITVSEKIKGDSTQVQDVLAHEAGHAHDARTNTNQYGHDSFKTKETNGKTPHDIRPEEKSADDFKDKVNREMKQYKKEHKQ